LLGHVVERLDDAFGQRATVHGPILGCGPANLQRLFQKVEIQFNWIAHSPRAFRRRPADVIRHDRENGGSFRKASGSAVVYGYACQD
jgi:hypothetical protein